MDNNFSEQLESLKLLDEYITSKVQARIDSAPGDAYESADTKDIATALSKAQGEFKAIIHNRENPFFKSSYADADIIVRSIRPVLAKFNLSFTQQEQPSPGGPTILTTRLRHSSGQWIETRARILPPKNDPQSYSSTLTYAKRNSLQSLLGITTTDDDYDDDAEKAMHVARTEFSAGTALNHKYNPREESPMTISSDELNFLRKKLDAWPSICEEILVGWKIRNLSDLPKDKYVATVKRVDEKIALEMEVKERKAMREAQ